MTELERIKLNLDKLKELERMTDELLVVAQKKAEECKADKDTTKANDSRG